MRITVSLGLLLVLSVLAGCASMNDGSSLREQVTADKQAYIDCADRQAAQMIQDTDFPPGTVATTALARCEPPWHAYVDGRQKLYMRQTRQVTFGHLQARSDGFALNMQLHDAIEKRARQARAKASESAPASTN